jgi:UDP-2,4-diacetamido-2,4,6-trideoxy-beta-L-altropyranose hydrolase
VPPPALCIRADADARMGTGHLMRCLALAQAWQDAGGRVTFLTACRLPELNARLAAEGAAVVPLGSEPGSDADADETRETALRTGASWVVLDGYHFSDAFQQRVRRDGIRVLTVDDYGHAGHYTADLVLNQNLHAHEGLYRDREPHTRLLLGTRFALLRREFWPWRSWRRAVPELASKVLVTLGGSDPENLTLRAIEAIVGLRSDLPSLQAVVVVGVANPHLPALEAAASPGGDGVRVLRNVTDMPALMAWADIAIAAGGSTSWERALLGLPSLVLVLADNQRDVARSCAEAGIGLDLGCAGTVSRADLAEALISILPDKGRREEMARKGRELVDGHGSERVRAEMTGPGIRVRPVRPEEAKLLWEWVNDPAVRRSAFHSEPIPWADHLVWFDRKLSDRACRIFVGIGANDTPIGQARFELIAPGEVVIDMSIDRGQRGAGLGSALIRTAVETVFAERFARRVHAYIKQDNEASLRAFERAGFRVLGSETIDGHTAAHAMREEINEPGPEQVYRSRE